MVFHDGVIMSTIKNFGNFAVFSIRMRTSLLNIRQIDLFQTKAIGNIKFCRFFVPSILQIDLEHNEKSASRWLRASDAE